jgi:hypothetical protein
VAGSHGRRSCPSGSIWFMGASFAVAISPVKRRLCWRNCEHWRFTWTPLPLKQHNRAHIHAICLDALQPPVDLAGRSSGEPQQRGGHVWRDPPRSIPGSAAVSGLESNGIRGSRLQALIWAGVITNRLRKSSWDRLAKAVLHGKMLHQRSSIRLD